MNEVLIELKKDYSFSRFTLDKFVNKLQEHETEIKKKNLVCSKCEKSRSDNVKLLRDVESLTLENKSFKKIRK
ncbi:hypothetical protein Hanom_Chr09g00792491 [Helianthus anomalus]